MHKKKLLPSLLLLLMAICLSFSWWGAALGHEGETKIVPASLTVKAGSELQVTVNGLVGADTATFRLAGISGKFDLGKFPISGDDFTQVLQIPADLPPGNYRLTVEGGKKSAKIVITVN